MNEEYAEVLKELQEKRKEEDYNAMEQRSADTYNNREQIEVIKHYTESFEVDNSVRKNNWAVFHKSVPLTFLSENDLFLLDIHNRIIRSNQLMMHPPNKITFESISDSDQLELFFYIQSKRAIGSKGGVMNERTLEATQILQRHDRGIAQEKRGAITNWLSKF